MVKVQREDFCLSSVLETLHSERKDIGAIASFIGLVRDLENSDLVSLTLEHYPGMAEKALHHIVKEAKQRWDLLDVAVIHRYGELKPAEQIVLVAVASAHRGESFQACEFIMDYLKTSAPFWKKETTTQTTTWVEAKQADNLAKQRWQN